VCVIYFVVLENLYRFNGFHCTLYLKIYQTVYRVFLSSLKWKIQELRQQKENQIDEKLWIQEQTPMNSEIHKKYKRKSSKDQKNDIKITDIDRIKKL
jgi:hypothetical protein